MTSWPGVSGAHDLRTRQSGPTRFIQIHIEMEDNLPLVQAHVIAEQVEQAILQRFLVQTSSFTGIRARLYPDMLGFRNSL